ncbi:2-dehydro-3-deoxy-6-phosphogalactonate aldolase [Pseudoduganella sp. FT55W]|uniref:2-dehydro-3-deoxy-6-phosphogalactonate aldolase n=1 Tax=Duganella rivi TaxID=2666083 RepID=A0A7X4KCZ0_9BURK|nr:2-dehydro-3-deoxy-6-phosphogalactonate aldolase [Duganella rivi]MYM68680.1 2-dehydro-3-deoxy-6-phosphogalactonate aldolase [Duganella rivi]
MTTPSHPATPLVAILRGLNPAEAVDVAKVLHAAGFRALEVPLNRPGAIEAIAAIVKLDLPDTLVGGGTMLTVEHVEAVHAAGGRLLVSPNCVPAVIRRAADLGMYCAPGVATPTEAFAALDAGAHALKIFPAESVGHGGIKALKSVLPAGTPVWPVGGVSPETMAAWVKAGATGFGIGGNLYTPGVTLEQLAERAAAFVSTWRTLAV